MTDVESKIVSDSLGDATHKEGTDYIKEKVGQADPATTTEGTAPTAAASESAPATTTKSEPITPAQPPASNPGAEDPTAGIAKDAGGVSSAAHVQSPTTTKEKRKSIVGQLGGFFGFGGKKEKEARNAGEDNSIAATASGVAVTAAGTTAVLADRTKSTVQENTGIDMGANGKKTANTGAAGADTTATTSGTSGTDPTTDPKEEVEKKNMEQMDTSGEVADKPPKPADPTKQENRSAIPVAGGEKLGEKHWGESKIVPDMPKPPPEEEAGVASKDGQPSKEVSDNTAKNTGGATGGPSGSKSPESEKKEKFFDKIKDKFKKDKK